MPLDAPYLFINLPFFLAKLEVDDCVSMQADHQIDKVVRSDAVL